MSDNNLNTFDAHSATGVAQAPVSIDNAPAIIDTPIDNVPVIDEAIVNPPDEAPETMLQRVEETVEGIVEIIVDAI